MTMEASHCVTLAVCRSLRDQAAVTNAVTAVCPVIHLAILITYTARCANSFIIAYCSCSQMLMGALNTPESHQASIFARQQ